MKPEHLKTRFVIQIGVLVKDVEATARNWAEFLGVEMPEVKLNNPYEITQAAYRGQPCKARLKSAFINFENIQIEFISPVDEEPSFWLDSLNQNGEGIHHIAFHVEGTEAFAKEMAQKGMPQIQRGEYYHGRYGYYDTMEKLKVTLESLEYDDGFPDFGVLK